MATEAVWSVIESCALALALVVSTSVLNTGALRLGLLTSGVVAASAFPPSAVVGYGVVYAVVVAIVIVPLVLTWRAHAGRLIGRILGTPLAGIPSPAWLDARARLEQVLHLDNQLLRRPITALSVLSPLLTAFVTTLVPGAS